MNLWCESHSTVKIVYFWTNWELSYVFEGIENYLVGKEKKDINEWSGADPGTVEHLHTLSLCYLHQQSYFYAICTPWDFCFAPPHPRGQDQITSCLSLKGNVWLLNFMAINFSLKDF